MNRPVLVKISIKKMQWFFLYSILIGALLVVIINSPQSSDDLYFRSKGILDIREACKFALYYGNGRFLGNLGNIYLSQFVCLRVIVKMSICLGIVLLLVRLCEVSWQEGIIALALFLLMSPKMFAQVIVWTSGFQNYLPPVFCMLACMIICKRCHRKGWLFLLFFLGFSGQLYAEHNTVISIMLSFAFLIDAMSIKKNIGFSLTWLTSNLAGGGIMYLIPHIFYVPNEFEDYQKLNLFSLNSFLNSIKGNSLQIAGILVEQLFIWILISSVLLVMLRERQIKNRLSECLLFLFPLYSIAVRFIGLIGVVWIKNSIGILVIHVLALLFYMVAFCILVHRGKFAYEKEIFFYVVMAIFSILPLLVVYPIGERCLFLSYTFILIIALTIIKESNIVRKYNHASFIIGASVIAISAFMIIQFVQIGKLDRQRIKYVENAIVRNADSINIFEIPSGYAHDIDIEWVYTNTYFVNQVGDIKFNIMDYKEWLAQYNK